MKAQTCPRCEDDWLDYATAMADIDRLAATDPESDPRHKDATDAEWWEWLLQTSGEGARCVSV